MAAAIVTGISSWTVICTGGALGFHFIENHLWPEKASTAPGA